METNTIYRYLCITFCQHLFIKTNIIKDNKTLIKFIVTMISLNPSDNKLNNKQYDRRPPLTEEHIKNLWHIFVLNML